jgi:plasmid maintenance system antidote protein VapI
LKPVHPGEVLREEFLKPFNLTEKILPLNWVYRLKMLRT